MAKVCPIAYVSCAGEALYSQEGLQMLHKQVLLLHPFPYSLAEQRLEALRRAGKMSIQGIQLKLSAVLNVAEGIFEIVDTGGRYILKPQSSEYAELPENEDLSMRLVAATGIVTPRHGLMYAKDNTLVYFIQRFDRGAKARKSHVEDFAQLAGKSRETKYDYSVEKVVSLLVQFCTFPSVEKEAFLKRFLVNYLIGNEDMHLKNYSLIRDEKRDVVTLAPAYDMLNSTLALPGAMEESALPLRGKKRKLTKDDLLQYLAQERLQLNTRSVDKVLMDIERAVPEWKRLIAVSFLSPVSKVRYDDIVAMRMAVLGIRW